LLSTHVRHTALGDYDSKENGERRGRGLIDEKAKNENETCNAPTCLMIATLQRSTFFVI
jgi:hypothetical protein